MLPLDWLSAGAADRSLSKPVVVGEIGWIGSMVRAAKLPLVVLDTRWVIFVVALVNWISVLFNLAVRLLGGYEVLVLK